MNIQLENKNGINILLFGAHCDDIEIGCGGTILKFIDQYKINKIKWVVFASSKTRKEEAIESAYSFLKDVTIKDIEVFDYSDSILDQSKLKIKSNFESIKKEFEPDIIFTHYRDDRHQDHRLISDLTWNTFRNHFILEYEIPKYDGDLGHPNTFVLLNDEYTSEKVRLLLDHFKSQRSKHWFDEETFKSLMRVRGLESANINKYSEAFYCRKISL